MAQEMDAPLDGNSSDSATTFRPPPPPLPRAPPRPPAPPFFYHPVDGHSIERLRLRGLPKCSIGLEHAQCHARFKVYKTLNQTFLPLEHSLSNLTISKVPTLIIGMDVYHGGAPSDPRSIATVVHSREWPQMSEYRAYVCTQSSNLKTVDSLFKPVLCDGESKDLGIMSELLQDFYDSSKSGKLKQIIIFRYGLDELQFAQVLDAEVNQIKTACKFFDDNSSAKFVVINVFEPGARETLLSEWNLQLRAYGGIIGVTRPSKYYVVENQARFSDEGLRELVDSFSYMQHLRSEAISLMAPLCYGRNSVQLEEHRTKRQKTKIDLDKVDLKSARKFIFDGEKLSVYALGCLNAKMSDKFDFEQHLFSDYAYRSVGSAEKKVWQHVSMYVRDLNGNRMIIFAELCYSGGKYESISHSVLDPEDLKAITYGCGFCFGCFGGAHPSPHPADSSIYVAGHWTYQDGYDSRLELHYAQVDGFFKDG